MRQGRERHAKERKKTRGGREIFWTNGKGGKKFLGKTSESREMIGVGGMEREGERVMGGGDRVMRVRGGRGSLGANRKGGKTSCWESSEGSEMIGLGGI